MESDSESRSTFASEQSFEVEDLSPPESPKVGDSVVEDDGGPESSLFELLAPALALPWAGALRADAMQMQERKGSSLWVVM